MTSTPIPGGIRVSVEFPVEAVAPADVAHGLAEAFGDVARPTAPYEFVRRGDVGVIEQEFRWTTQPTAP